jgi:serine/threonine protein phosphatase PrpC
LRASLSQGARDPQAAAEMLVDAAVAGGAPDNATAVVVTRVR